MSDSIAAFVLRPGIICTVVLISTSGLLSSAPAKANAPDNCQRIDTTELPSPDARWIARVYGKICDLGITSSAAVLVDLSRAGVKESPTTVLSIDMPADKKQWAKPKWETSQRLAIQLPGSANIALQMATLQDVAIQVRFCPNDQAQRSRWLVYKTAYHKWVADMAAWSQAKGRNSAAASSRPVPPVPPEGHEPDPSCE